MPVMEQSYLRIEKRIAALYILLLPVRMLSPLTGLTAVFSACANYFDFILHALGFVLMLMTTRGKIYTTRTANMFVRIVILFEIISFGMALILSNSLGTLDGEDTFSAVLAPAIYYIHYLIMMFYNIYIFGMFTRDEISRLLEKLIAWNLVLGYIQILICNGVGIVADVYDALNFLGVFKPSSYITRISRIPLSGSEPASAGVLIGILIFPFLMSKIINRERAGRYFAQLLLWLPVIYFTKSSTCFILVFVDAIAFVILGLKNRSLGKGLLLILAPLIAGLLALVILSTTDFSSNPVLEQIKYLLFEKSGDRTNESTVTRTIPTYINFKIFLEYPFTGVGNGNQGFFYSKFFPAWGRISSSTYNKITGVADGGVFIPSLFSGYGTVGVIAFAICTVNYIRETIAKRHELKSFYYMFLIAFAAFLFNSFQTDYFGNYITIFVLCIPFMTSCRNEASQRV